MKGATLFNHHIVGLAGAVGFLAAMASSQPLFSVDRYFPPDVGTARAADAGPSVIGASINSPETAHSVTGESINSPDQATLVFTGQASRLDEGHPVIIGFHTPPGKMERTLITDVGGNIRRVFHLIPAIAATLPEAAIEKLRQTTGVVYVQEDQFARALEGEAEYDAVWGVTRVGADIVHAEGNRGAGVSVAVLDSGIDYTHEDLDDNYMGGYDFVFEDSDPMDDAYNSHGTHVAGTIGAELNGVGVVGVAPEISLYAVKVLDGATFGQESDVIAGIEWAVDNNMDIANLSLGVAADSAALLDASNAAFQSGLLLIAAAGNTNGDSVLFPAAYDSVIAVSGTTSSDQVIYSSALGPEIELAAPGSSIYSTTIGGGYGELGGTSQAAPHVSGVAALLMAAGVSDLDGDGVADHRDVRLELQQLAIDLGDPGRDSAYGFGLVRAVEEDVTPNPTPEPTPEPSPTPEPTPTPDPPVEIDLHLKKFGGPPPASAKNVRISDGVYDVTITNDSLRMVTNVISEGGVTNDELSSYVRFPQWAGQTFDFTIDATDATLDIVFTPFGSTDAYADILILEQR